MVGSDLEVGMQHSERPRFLLGLGRNGQNWFGCKCILHRDFELLDLQCTPMVSVVVGDEDV